MIFAIVDENKGWGNRNGVTLVVENDKSRKQISIGKECGDEEISGNLYIHGTVYLDNEECNELIEFLKENMEK